MQRVMGNGVLICVFSDAESTVSLNKTLSEEEAEESFHPGTYLHINCQYVGGGVRCGGGGVRASADGQTGSIKNVLTPGTV